MTEELIKEAREAHEYATDGGDFSDWERLGLLVPKLCDALVAAAGAAPQEPESATSRYINPSLPGMIRNLWKSDPSEASARTALGLAGDLIQELIDLRAAPAQVDEAKLTEALREVDSVHQIHGTVCLCGADQLNLARPRTEHITNAAAELLRGGQQ